MPANPFTTETAALLYAAGRPDYSAMAANIARRMTGLEEPVDVAVDIGSGTGISTAMLTELARSVIGVEPATAMVRHARPARKVRYVMGAAEALPIADVSCELIGVGSALHWFDRDRFLAESLRIAKPGAWLVIHDHWFTGMMKGNPEFREWVTGTYLARYPSPPRNRWWQPGEDLGHWRNTEWELYDHEIDMDAGRLIQYVLSQSNLQVVMERGDRTEEELRTWVRNEVEPFFTKHTATMLFAGSVSVFRRNEEH